jgi:predicted component of type VI protein secretion system
MNFVLPSLFDRLTEQVPPEQWKAEEMLEQKVRRDLEALFNTKTLESLQSEISLYHEVRSSTVNFGITDYAGLMRNDLNIQTAIDYIRVAIKNFEPRIIESTLEIIPDSLLSSRERTTGELSNDTKHKLFEKGAFEFTIRGQICANERPINFECNTNVCFLTGDISID